MADPDSEGESRRIHAGVLLLTAYYLLETINVFTLLPQLPRRVRFVSQALLPALTCDVLKLVYMPVHARCMSVHNVQSVIKLRVTSSFTPPNPPAAAPSVSDRDRDQLICILSHMDRGIGVVKMVYACSLSPNISTDTVLALHVSVWPQQAMEWIFRPRQRPSQEVVQQVVTQGFHLVSKPRAHLSETETECDWRISFALSEQILARARSPRQKKVYYLLKVVYYKHLKPIGSSDTSLKSYACKTVMLWVSEEQDVRWWEENSTLTVLIHLLKRLLKCLQERRMRYYFIPEVNLFDGWKTPQCVIDRCVAVITGLIDKPQQHFTRDMDILAHRLLLAMGGGDKPHDAQKLVDACEEVRTWIQLVLSVYTVTAETGIVAPGEQVGDVYEHLVEVVLPVGEIVDDLIREVSGESVAAVGECTSLINRMRDITLIATPDHDNAWPADEYVPPALLSSSIWAHGLLNALYEFLDILHQDERCVDDPKMSEICKRSRRLVELMLQPHILCDAHVLCDTGQDVPHRSLNNTGLIKHFITVIHRMRRASRDIDGIYDLIGNLMDSSTSDETQAQQVEDIGFHSLSLD